MSFCKIKAVGGKKNWVQVLSVKSDGYVDLDFLAKIAHAPNWTDAELSGLTDELVELEVEYNYVEITAENPAYWDWRIL